MYGIFAINTGNKGVVHTTYTSHEYCNVADGIGGQCSDNVIGTRNQCCNLVLGFNI